MLADDYPNGDDLEAICGYYLPPMLAENKNSVDNQIEDNQDKHAIEFARYAVSDINGFKDTRVQQFSTKVAERILEQHRTNGAYEKGIADYLNLNSLGIVSASFENYGGLCFSNLNEPVKALECYLRACKLNPDNIIFHGDAALIATRLQQYERGLEIISEIKQEKLESLRKITPKAYWTYAVLLARAKTSESPLYNPALMKEIGTQALQLDFPKDMSAYSLVEGVIRDIGQ